MRSATTACDRLAIAWLAIAWLAIAGCEVATGGAFGGSFSSVGPGPELGEDGSSSTGDPPGKGDDAPGTKGDDAPDDPPEDASSDDGTTDAGEDTTDESTGVLDDGAPNDAGAETTTDDVPTIDPWSSCLDGGCGPDMVCMAEQAGVPGVCTQPCAPAGDPTGCPPAPEGNAETTCITLEGGSWCALDCSHAGQCPAGTLCQALADDLGPVVICL